MTTFRLVNIPTALDWLNQPLDWRIDPDGDLTLMAGSKTDWFIDPAGGSATCNAPGALFVPPDQDVLLSARVRVSFAADFDAGVLAVYVRDDLWAKLCFEFSPQHQPMIVSVVTRGVSDDCNSVPIAGPEVYLRVTRRGHTFAFHYSHDGRWWHLVRYFSLAAAETESERLGFVAQSPTGEGCTAVFAEIAYLPRTLQDLRDGT